MWIEEDEIPPHKAAMLEERAYRRQLAEDREKGILVTQEVLDTLPVLVEYKKLTEGDLKKHRILVIKNKARQLISKK